MPSKERGMFQRVVDGAIKSAFEARVILVDSVIHRSGRTLVESSIGPDGWSKLTITRGEPEAVSREGKPKA